jgi:CDP-diacylglycerol--glycerol-3-phosphate 3-phosphatidyltransferase
MTPPNVVSLLRVLAVPVVMAVILYGDAWLAAAVYVAAAASDSLDGYLARSRNWTSVAGAFLDPLADKLLVTGAMLALVEIDRLSSWAVIAIVAREFAISGVRMIAAARNDVISASGAGKLKAFAQNVMIVVLLLSGGEPWLDGAAVAVAIALSYWSLLGYAVRARRHFAARPVAP